MDNEEREAKVVAFPRSNKITKTHFKRTDCIRGKKNAKCSHLGLENDKSQRQTSDTLHQNDDNRTGEGERFCPCSTVTWPNGRHESARCRLVIL